MLCGIHPFLHISVFIYFYFILKERDKESMEGRDEAAGGESQASSALSVQRLMQDSNPETERS